MTVPPSLSLGDRYTLVERIAVGGMGEVWRGQDEVLGRPVAVKVLKESYAADPSFRQRFRNEAKHTAALSYPGIAGVFDYGEVGDTAFLVMELVPGEPLSNVLHERGPLPTAEALDIVGQVGLALQAAHDAGVIHRDVKPGNLLVRPDGVVKVTDFGIARAVDAAPVTQTGLVVGTAAYLSPEQAGGLPVTAASDVYSLGVVAYECLAGARPFDGASAVGVAMAHVNQPPPPLPATVPPLVADFVMRALDKDPQRRPPSAGDFGRTALALAAQLDEPGPTPTPTPTPTKLMTVPPAAAPAGNAPALTPPTATPPTPAPPAPAGGEPFDARQGRIRAVVIGVGVAVVLVGFLLLRSCGGSSSTARVPAVTGESYAHAAATVRHRGFGVTRDTVASIRPRGTVLHQSVPAGRRVSTDSTITLTVSRGPALVHVDPGAYLGHPAADVVSTLRSEHLRVRTITQPSAGAPGTVTAIDPNGSVREGSTVTVTVAAAAEPSGPGPKEPKPKPPKPHGHGHGDG